MNRISFQWYLVFLILGGILPVTVTGFTGRVVVGLNCPMTGPYGVQGLDQLRASELARDEINAGGGILGRELVIKLKDSRSRVDVTRANVLDLIRNESSAMVFGGSASSVAVEASRVCHENGVIFFGTLTYSTETTGVHGHRTTFRECYDSWMGAKAIASFLNQRFPAAGNRYFYISADYTWGKTTEASLRHFTGTTDIDVHKGIKTPFPDATDMDFKKALAFARMLKPDVLVLVLFGREMGAAIRQATILGLKKETQIVVPNLTLGMAESGGPKVMEGVVGALPWCWKVPYQYDYPGGKRFVEAFQNRYGRYPSTSGASAYTILHEYRSAVERAGSFETKAVVTALEGHDYIALKDRQVWRDFDHQSVQTVFSVVCRPAKDVLKDPFHLDYFEILGRIPGEEAVITFERWKEERIAAGRMPWLERFPGEGIPDSQEVTP